MRTFHSEGIEAVIQTSFAPDEPLTFQWDGKMLPALSDKETVNQLAVLVSVDGVMKLLDALKLPNETGISLPNTVFQLIYDWNFTERV